MLANYAALIFLLDIKSLLLVIETGAAQIAGSLKVYKMSEPSLTRNQDFMDSMISGLFVFLLVNQSNTNQSESSCMWKKAVLMFRQVFTCPVR